jgi:hypothetical protein
MNRQVCRCPSALATKYQYSTSGQKSNGRWGWRGSACSLIGAILLQDFNGVGGGGTGYGSDDGGFAGEVGP